MAETGQQDNTVIANELTDNIMKFVYPETVTYGFSPENLNSLKLNLQDIMYRALRDKDKKKALLESLIPVMAELGYDLKVKESGQIDVEGILTVNNSRFIDKTIIPISHIIPNSKKEE